MGWRFDAMYAQLKTSARGKGLLSKVRAAVDRYVESLERRNQPATVKKFGGCPECHECHGILHHLNGQHYCICIAHRLSWSIGTASPVLNTNDDFLAETVAINFGFKQVRPWGEIREPGADADDCPF